MSGFDLKNTCHVLNKIYKKKPDSLKDADFEKLKTYLGIKVEVDGDGRLIIKENEDSSVTDYEDRRNAFVSHYKSKGNCTTNAFRKGAVSVVSSVGAVGTGLVRSVGAVGTGMMEGAVSTTANLKNPFKSPDELEQIKKDRLKKNQMLLEDTVKKRDEINRHNLSIRTEIESINKKIKDCESKIAKIENERVNIETNKLSADIADQSKYDNIIDGKNGKNAQIETQNAIIGFLRKYIEELEKIKIGKDAGQKKIEDCKVKIKEIERGIATQQSAADSASKPKYQAEIDKNKTEIDKKNTEIDTQNAIIKFLTKYIADDKLEIKCSDINTADCDAKAYELDNTTISTIYDSLKYNGADGSEPNMQQLFIIYKKYARDNTSSSRASWEIEIPRLISIHRNRKIVGNWPKTGLVASKQGLDSAYSSVKGIFKDITSKASPFLPEIEAENIAKNYLEIIAEKHKNILDNIDSNKNKMTESLVKKSCATIKKTVIETLKSRAEYEVGRYVSRTSLSPYIDTQNTQLNEIKRVNIETLDSKIKSDSELIHELTESLEHINKTASNADTPNSAKKIINNSNVRKNIEEFIQWYNSIVKTVNEFETKMLKSKDFKDMGNIVAVGAVTTIIKSYKFNTGSFKNMVNILKAIKQIEALKTSVNIEDYKTTFSELFMKPYFTPEWETLEKLLGFDEPTKKLFFELKGLIINENYNGVIDKIFFNDRTNYANQSDTYTAYDKFTNTTKLNISTTAKLNVNNIDKTLQINFWRWTHANWANWETASSKTALVPAELVWFTPEWKHRIYNLNIKGTGDGFFIPIEYRDEVSNIKIGGSRFKHGVFVNGVFRRVSPKRRRRPKTAKLTLKPRLKTKRQSNRNKGTKKKQHKRK